MAISNPTKNVWTFEMREIASWRLSRQGSGDSDVQVELPPVQRGLVWDVNQIEIFWDSLLRGFPFGALVFARSGADSNHFLLLDGQQRCDAIFWGMQPHCAKQDSYDKNDSGKTDEQILWLDLLPQDRLKHTTRKYLARLTTKAHPWGFWRNDDASPLSLDYRRDFFKQFAAVNANRDVVNSPDNAGAGWRPPPYQCVPFDAGLPVPLPVLFEHYHNDNGIIDWDGVAQHDLVRLAEDWKGKTLKRDFLSGPTCETIMAGIRTAWNTPVVAVCLASDASDDQEQSGLEEIFVRLNRNGTVLSEEELAYSMIKVGWPKIKNAMDAISQKGKRHAAEARLIRMGMRAALTRQVDQPTKLEAALSPAQIRKMFGTQGTSHEAHDDKSERIWRQALEGYFLPQIELEDKSEPILKALEWIDAEMGYSAGQRPFGIPAYLRSAIAWHSPEVFSWLMLQADRHKYKAIDPEAAKAILRVALSLHWFAGDRDGAIKRLLELSDDRDLATVRLADLQDPEGKRTLMYPVLTPEQLAEAIHLCNNGQSIDDELLRTWKSSIWQGVVLLRGEGKDGDLSIQIGRTWHDIGMSVERIRRQFELVVYAQRQYINDVFNGFDPSDRRLWKGHSRPWDYDHILAKTVLDRRKSESSGEYHGICTLWQETIGNFVAIDLVDNRSAGGDSPSGKYAIYKALAQTRNWAPMLSLSPEINVDTDIPSLEEFELTLPQTGDARAASRFIQACQRRMIALYRHWFVEMGIAQ